MPTTTKPQLEVVQGRVGRPGTAQGPCLRRCSHETCTVLQREAARRCSECGLPIGIETDFLVTYDGSDFDPGEYAHAACRAAAVEGVAA